MKLSEAQITEITKAVNMHINSLAENVVDNTEKIIRFDKLSLYETLEFGSKLESLCSEIMGRVEETIRKTLEEFNG